MKTLLQRYCAACFRSRDLSPLSAVSTLALCAGCRDELDELAGMRAVSQHGSMRVTSLYGYRSLVRELVLRAKVQNDDIALRLVADLVLTRRETIETASRADILVASPSSLWGRLRGRFDLAHGMTEAMAAAYGKPVACAPYELFWRWSKRARLAQRAKRGPVAAAFFPPWLAARLREQWYRRHGKACGLQRILIVDDVVTTGETIRQVARTMADLVPVERIEVLTLASAER